MSYFNIVAATTENTVVTEYIPEPRTAEGYQSEADLEREFIRRLGELGYEYLTIHKEVVWWKVYLLNVVSVPYQSQ